MNPDPRIGDRQDKRPPRGIREDQSPTYTEHDFSIPFRLLPGLGMGAYKIGWLKNPSLCRMSSGKPG